MAPLSVDVVRGLEGVGANGARTCPLPSSRAAPSSVDRGGVLRLDEEAALGPFRRQEATSFFEGHFGDGFSSHDAFSGDVAACVGVGRGSFGMLRRVRLWWIVRRDRKGSLDILQKNVGGRRSSDGTGHQRVVIGGYVMLRVMMWALMMMQDVAGGETEDMGTTARHRRVAVVAMIRRSLSPFVVMGIQFVDFVEQFAVFVKDDGGGDGRVLGGVEGAALLVWLVAIQASVLSSSGMAALLIVRLGLPSRIT